MIKVLLNYLVIVTAYAADATTSSVINSKSVVASALLLGGAVFEDSLDAKAKAMILAYWYMPDVASGVEQSISRQMEANRASIRSVFGSPENGVAVIGSAKVNGMLMIFCARRFSGINAPVKVTFVSRDGGYALCGLDWGVSVLGELSQFSERTVGE